MECARLAHFVAESSNNFRSHPAEYHPCHPIDSSNVGGCGRAESWCGCVRIGVLSNAVLRLKMTFVSGNAPSGTSWHFRQLINFFFTGLCHSGPMAGNLDEQLSKSVTQLECTDATSAGCDGPIDRISSSDPRAVRPLPPADWQLAGPLFHPHFVSFPRKQ